MALFVKEWKQGTRTLAVWTLGIAAMLMVCIFLFPEMKHEMDSMTKLFANMGTFTKAFGMDLLNFGELSGFYGVECGNVIGIGGALFAAYLGAGMLSKEEKEHTAEFLMTHPVSRFCVVLQKFLSVMIQLVVLNLVVSLLSWISIRVIGEQFPAKEFVLLHGSYLLLQLEIGAICFGISAWIRRGSLGIGLGLAAVLYFLDLISNISTDAALLQYITPFAYAKPAHILTAGSLDWGLAALGIVYGAVAAAAGFWWYCRKDLTA
ncbi:MAG: ABC transporter permease subunit [Lachnospiraceae bacterium]|nr:ABC transporter permease subunit [Lachnospiraceae bacterium]